MPIPSPPCLSITQPKWPLRRSQWNFLLNCRTCFTFPLFTFILIVFYLISSWFAQVAVLWRLDNYFLDLNSLLVFWISISPGFGDEKIDLSCLISNLCYLPINCDDACIFSLSCVCFKVSANVYVAFPCWLIGVELGSWIVLSGIPSEFSTYSVMGIEPRSRVVSLEKF